MGRIIKFFVDLLLIAACFAIVNQFIDLSFLNLPYTQIPVKEKTSEFLLYVLIGILIADVLFNGLFGINIVLLIVLILIFRNWLIGFLTVLVYRIIRTLAR